MVPLLISGPICVSGCSGSPTLRALAFDASLRLRPKTSAILLSTTILSVDMQIWPRLAGVCRFRIGYTNAVEVDCDLLVPNQRGNQRAPNKLNTYGSTLPEPYRGRAIGGAVHRTVPEDWWRSKKFHAKIPSLVL